MPTPSGFLRGEPPAPPVAEYRVEVLLPRHGDWLPGTSWLDNYNSARNAASLIEDGAQVRVVQRWCTPPVVVEQSA